MRMLFAMCIVGAGLSVAGVAEAARAHAARPMRESVSRADVSFRSSKPSAPRERPARPAAAEGSSEGKRRLEFVACRPGSQACGSGGHKLDKETVVGPQRGAFERTRVVDLALFAPKIARACTFGGCRQ